MRRKLLMSQKFLFEYFPFAPDTLSSLLSLIFRVVYPHLICAFLFRLTYIYMSVLRSCYANHHEYRSVQKKIFRYMPVGSHSETILRKCTTTAETTFKNVALCTTKNNDSITTHYCHKLFICYDIFNDAPFYLT